MDREKVLGLLNEALAQEHACQIRYRTHAAVVCGPYAEAVEDRLKEIAEDEKEHADAAGLLQPAPGELLQGCQRARQVARRDLFGRQLEQEVRHVSS